MIQHLRTVIRPIWELKKPIYNFFNESICENTQHRRFFLLVLLSRYLTINFTTNFCETAICCGNVIFCGAYNRTAARVTCHMWHFRRFTLCNHELSDIRLLAIYACQLKPVVRQVHGRNLQMTRLAIIPLTVNLTAIYLCQYLPVVYRFMFTWP